MAEENGEHMKLNTSLPVVFTIESLTHKALPIYVTILHTLNGVLLKELPFDFHNRQLFFRLSDDIRRRLNLPSNSCFYVKLQRSNMEKEWTSGIIYGIYENYFGLIQFTQEARLNDVSSSIDMRLPWCIDRHFLCQDWMGKVDSKFPSTEDIKRKAFKIRPPTSKENRSNRADMLGFETNFSEDPSIYLFNKYYGIMYSLKTPLSYFPKIAFTKMKLLCKNDFAILKDKLMGLRLSIEEFDCRHNGRLGILEDSKRKEISLFAIKCTVEREHQQEFIEKYLRPGDGDNNIAANGSGSEDNTEMKHEREHLLNLIMELKTREAQLQLLILFELFACLEIDESRFFDNNIRKEEMNHAKSRNFERPSLVRRRKQNKRIIPTFLGMGILSLGVMKERHEVENTAAVDDYNIYKSLNFFIDRIGLWDTLIENSPHYGTCNMVAFLDYVIIPYYRQRLPLTTKYILNKAKELTTRVKANPEKRREQKQRRQGLTRNGSNPSNDLSSRASRILSLLGNLLTTNNSLKYEMSSQADVLPFSLKKSKSSLSSGLNEKRQVDVSFSLKSFGLAQGPRLANEFPKNTNFDQKNSSNRFFFSRATKTKSQDTVGDSLQVEATPIKKKQKANYLEEYGYLLHGSPKGGNDFSKRFFDTSTSGSKSPLINRPTNEKNEGSYADSHHYKVVEATPRKPATHINEEPSKASGIMSSPIGCVSSPCFDANPSSSIQGPTINNKKKPGKPLILEGSPFLDFTQNDFATARARDNNDDKITTNQYY